MEPSREVVSSGSYHDIFSVNRFKYGCDNACVNSKWSFTGEDIQWNIAGNFSNDPLRGGEIMAIAIFKVNVGI